MPKVLFRSVRSGKRQTLLKDLNSIVRTEINRTIDQKIKPPLIEAHERVVSGWKSDVDFSSRKFVRPDNISVNIFPSGADKKIWEYVDKGTRPHTIRAKNVPTLKFRTNYKSKTLAKPARTVSGGGKASGPWRSPVQVNHPGTEARNFTAEIAEDIKPYFKRQIENAFKRAADAVRR